MATRPRNVYELMNWAAEQHDLDPSQRKQLYEWLESESILDTSKDPYKEASKYAKDLKKEAAMLKRSIKKAGAMSEKGAVKSARKKTKEDIEDIQDDFALDGGDGATEGGNWYDDDVDREDYPDLYDSDY